MNSKSSIDFGRLSNARLVTRQVAYSNNKLAYLVGTLSGYSVTVMVSDFAWIYVCEFTTKLELLQSVHERPHRKIFFALIV